MGTGRGRFRGSWTVDATAVTTEPTVSTRPQDRVETQRPWQAPAEPLTPVPPWVRFRGAPGLARPPRRRLPAVRHLVGARDEDVHPLRPALGRRVHGRRPMSRANQAAEPKGTAEPKRTAEPDQPLISAEALARRLGEPHVRVVDVRWTLGQPGAGRRAYDAGHIPGAIFLDLDGDFAVAPGPGRAGRHPLPPPEAFAERLGKAGIGSGDLVVAYDDVGGWVAARLWWMLDDLGHRGGAAVLDGGLGAWVASGGTLTTDVPASPGQPVPLELADHWTNVIERDELRGRLGEVVLLDGRGAPRYRGEVEPIDAYPGHIPTAVSAPTDGQSRRAQRSVPASVRVARPVRAVGRSRGRRRRGRGRRTDGHLVRQRRVRLPRVAGDARLPGCPIRSSTSARTATGRPPGNRSRSARSRAHRRRLLTAKDWMVEHERRGQTRGEAGEHIGRTGSDRHRRRAGNWPGDRGSLRSRGRPRLHRRSRP